MTPAEAVAAIERLVEAGAKASPGEWRVIPKRYEVESVEGMVAGGIGSGDGYFIVAAANARPALSALAGMCVLDVEVVRLLLGLCKNHYDTSTLPAWHQDQFAAAEAELRRVEVRDA